MKTVILTAIILLFGQIYSVKADFEKPYNSECAGTNFRIDRKVEATSGGSWVVQNIRLNSEGGFDWANWECVGSGTECGVGNWCTRWATGVMYSGWIQNEDGEWEPPLPEEAGYWLKLYFDECPRNFDEINQIYY